jgi:hypothetical protein
MKESFYRTDPRVLYQARIHPSCPAPALSEQNLKDLHHQLHAVPTKAVEVNADSRQFPEDWLFRWRWSKGKKQAKGSKKKKVIENGSDEEASEDELKPAGKDFLALVGSIRLTWVDLTGSRMVRLRLSISLKWEAGPRR